MSKGGNEADAIVLFAFRQISCAIPDDITSIGNLSNDATIEIVARSIRLITAGAAKYPIKLPQGMAARHRLCTDMALQIKDMGYMGECGYNQILYPAESTTRPILGFLVERLPRVEEDAAEDILGASALLDQQIRGALTEWSKETYLPPWCPSFCPGGGRVHEPRYRMRRFRARSLDLAGPPITSQVPLGEDVAASVFERNLSLSLREQRALEDVRLDDDDDGGGSVQGMEGRGRVSGRQPAEKAASEAARARLGEAMATAGLGGGKKGPSLRDLIDELIAESDEATARSFPSGSNKSNDGCGRGTRFTHATEFGQEASAGIQKEGSAFSGRAASAVADPAAARGRSEEDAPAAGEARAAAEAAARAAEVAALEARVRELEGERAGAVRAGAIARARARRCTALLAGAAEEARALARERRVLDQALPLLPDHEAHALRLRARVGAAAARLAEMGEEWELHRVPLVAALRSARDARRNRRAKCRAMVDEMRRWRSEMQAMALEVRSKEAQAKALREEESKLPRDVNRTLYTYRIMDIIASVAKQKREIHKIIREIKQVQKDINAAGERLSRAEVLADETVFAAAKRSDRRGGGGGGGGGESSSHEGGAASACDAAMVSAYRMLTQLRAGFDGLVHCVTESGKAEATRRAFEAKVAALGERVGQQPMARLLADLAQVHEDNRELAKRLRQIQNKAGGGGEE